MTIDMAVNDFKSDHFKAWVSKISVQVHLYTILKAAWYGALQLAHVYPKQFYTSLQIEQACGYTAIPNVC